MTGLKAAGALPIDAWIPQVLESLEGHSSLVLRASPGAGKTTRVPPALLSASWCQLPSGPREVWVLEPRRLAAKLSASRVAEERNCRVGGEVGYHFRLENRSGPETRLLYLTEGVFLRRLLSNPDLQGVAAVVLDEFHERHLQTDLALALVRRLQRSQRPDLRLIVMSATLDTEQLQAYLGQGASGAVPVLSVDAPRFPVRILHSESSVKDGAALARAVVSAVETCLEEQPTGDILVFLPGMGEILRVRDSLGEDRRFQVFPLHGDLSSDEQGKAVGPPIPGVRRVILSTNIAETSLTIPGVAAVIDSGLARVASLEGGTGISSLRTRPISRASAIQRAGRAGRTEPGFCLRLFGQGDFDSRAAFETPEIRRLDLAPALLELAGLGVADPQSLEWFDRPEKSVLETSLSLLELLGLVTRAPSGSIAITREGRQLLRWPLHPRLGHLLLKASDGEAFSWALRLVVLLEEEVFENGDLLEQLGRWEKTPLGRLEGPLGRQETRLLETSDRRVFSGARLPPLPAVEKDLRKLLLHSFPDRVVRVRAVRDQAARERELQLAFGGQLYADVRTFLENGESLWVAVGVRLHQAAGETRGARRFQYGVEIEPDWLLEIPGNAIQEEEVFEWRREAERLEGRARLKYGNLVLSESNLHPSERPKVAARELVRILRNQGFQGLGEHSEAWEQFRERLGFLRNVAGKLAESEKEGLRELLEGGALEDLLQGLLERGVETLGLFSFNELRRFESQEGEGLVAVALSGLSSATKELLDRLLPQVWRMPHGRRLKIQYSSLKPPVVESRLQDFFGASRGPSLLGGREPLTLHLLAPNGRPVQVTQDLASFWARVYPELRGALSRRYPRHPWPEDPLQALPPEPRAPRRS
jgi:ATP-dependent helicase HrpB